ncbi:MAG: hypothetical protein GX214_02980 [Clostridiales bacterium]|nr:hypothetical protein [Clostridiales bacterium]
MYIKAIEEYIDNSLIPNLNKFKSDDFRENIFDLISDINLLWDIDKHYNSR